MGLKLGLPSKGRLQSQVIEWFAARGVMVERSASEREYSGRVAGVADVELVLLSAGEIPKEIAAGRIHVGVTGLDLIREKLPTDAVVELAPMGLGHATLVLAVPSAWVDVRTLDDFDAVCGQFRQIHGHRLRIATKYHNLIRQNLSDFGVADYQLVDSQGATEGTVKNGTAEAVADITSTGDTLRANHLRVLDDGQFLRSEAWAFASNTAEWDGAAQTGYEALAEKLDWPDR
ncbi:MAG: ATP phosphoribosyltransferase [Pseudomonadota bacterium]